MPFSLSYWYKTEHLSLEYNEIGTGQAVLCVFCWYSCIISYPFVFTAHFNRGSQAGETNFCYLSVCSCSMCLWSIQYWLAECAFSLHVCSWLVFWIVEAHPVEIFLSFCIVQQLWHAISLCPLTCQLFHANWCWELHDLCTLSWSCSRKMAWCLAYVPWLGEPLAGKDTIFASLSVCCQFLGLGKLHHMDMFVHVW